LVRDVTANGLISSVIEAAVMEFRVQSYTSQSQ